MTDKSIEQLATYIVVPLVGNFLVNAYKAFLQHKEGKRTKDVAVKVDEVKTDLAVSNAHQNGKLDEIHRLVNGALGKELDRAARALREVANLKRTPEAIREADEADQRFMDHQVKLQREEYAANPDLTPDKDERL